MLGCLVRRRSHGEDQTGGLASDHMKRRAPRTRGSAGHTVTAQLGSLASLNSNECDSGWDY